MVKYSLVRRVLILAVLLAFLVPFLTSCGGGGEGGTSAPSAGSSANPTEPPERLTENEKPNKIDANNKYANVKVYDKFGVWPIKQGEEYYSSEVGTWFTVWWTEEGTPTYNFHWFQENRLKPLDYGYYSSGDMDYLQSVFVRMEYIGIDFLMLDDTNGHWNDNGLIARNMQKCFRAASLLDGYSPKIAIATGAPLREGDTAEQQREFDEYYSYYYDKYSEVFYQYEGKPLLLMYVAEKASQRYSDNQGRFTQRYGTGLVSWQNRAADQTIFKTQGNWGWVFDMQNAGTEIMGVQPGYNKPGMPQIEREHGKHYIEQWLAAIKADPKVIMIPSYNDHCEETGWEATTLASGSSVTDAYGDDPYLYEKITEAYLALRYGYIEGFFYQTEGESQVYQCVNGTLKKVNKSNAGKEPIILIPKGYMAWEQSRSKV